MHVGALEARRWAGLVFAAGPDDGIGVRLAFTDPEGQRRELDDWYWMVSRVGPHAPDGSYARVEFDLGAEPSPESRPSASTMVLEWSRRGDAVAMRATVKAPGRLEVIGDAPWGWAARWVEVGVGPGGGGGLGGGSGQRGGGGSGVTGGPGDGDVWRARLRALEVAAAFSAGTRACQAPDARLEEVARALDIGDGGTGRVAMVAVWGGHGGAARSARLVGQADAWIDEARAEWGRRRPRSAACPDLLESIHDNLMWTILLQPETGRLYTPAGRRWIFPRPGVEAPDDWTVFGWDSFFNAIQLATVSGDLAWATLLAGTQSRYPNGNVPNWRSRRGGTPDRSQPPVGSFAALKLHRIHPDLDALAAAYPDLVAWSEWWRVTEKNGRPRREGLTPGLLSWGSDTDLVPGPDQVPPWEAGASGHQRAAWESGQDDLPLWDDAEWDPERQILAMSAVDLCSYRALDLESLSRIARILGDDPTANRLGAEYHHLVTAMNRHLWSEDAGLYLDELPTGHSTRVAASNFLPLIAGVPSRDQAHRMIATLRDPSRFWGDWVIPTISRDDPAFADQQYWRGSIWPPMNYLILQGLRRYGFDDLAEDLAWKGARMFLADRRRTGFCRENFDSRTGKGCGQRFQSWAPLFALGALEQVAHATPPDYHSAETDRPWAPTKHGIDATRQIGVDDVELLSGALVALLRHVFGNGRRIEFASRHLQPPRQGVRESEYVIRHRDRCLHAIVKPWIDHHVKSSCYRSVNVMRYHAFGLGRSLPPLTLLLLALPGCSGDIKLAAGEILHPTPENAPPADASLITTDTVPAGLTEDALSAWRAARDRFLNATTALALGTDDDEGPELFGMIGDVAFDAEGNILVADAADYSVRTFGPDGSHMVSFGREGEGPMEFSGEPHSIEALADGRILVGTRGSTKIFGPAADGYQHLETVSVYSDHFCLSADERMFTANHDRQSDRVLHEVDQAGDSIVRNFGHGYLDDESLFRSQLSDGEIACLDDPLRLVFVFNEHPIVRAHHPGEDEPLWTATFEDYLQPHHIGRYRESGRASIRSVARDSEVVVNPHALSPGHIVVQTLRFRFLTFSFRLRTYLLDAATGHGALISEDLPQIREIASGRIVVAWDDPYPRLEVRELGEGGGGG